MSIDKFVILGNEIPKGKGIFLEMEVAKLHNRNSIKIPVIVERGKLDGPTLLLMGGLHGDETNGVAIVREIIKKKYNKPKRGTIICIPVFNVFGYLGQTRVFPDGRDLNRVFPGSENGSLASQFAHLFTKEIAPLVDYLVDFHTGGAERSNYPNVRCNFNQQEIFKLASAFGAPFLVHSNYIPKSVRDTVNKMGKTTILYEGGKSKNLDKMVIRIGVEGALNIMKYLGLQNGEPDINKETVIVEKSKWIRAPFSGMYQLDVKNGSMVTKKMVLGKISDPYGEFERKVIAPFDCYIFGVNTAPIVNKGDALFHVSLETK